MNKLLIITCLLCFSALLFAQPINDDCSGLINLGDAPICPGPDIFTNLDATQSNIGNDNFPNCFFGDPDRDVWFSFDAVASIEDYLITVTGETDGMGSTPMLMPQIALYRGDICAVDELVLLDCASAIAGQSTVTMQTNGLTAGITYYLRINDWTLSGISNWGSFSLCIEEFVQTVYTIDEGSASVCSGELYDSGGPNGNYGNGENFIFTICPDDPHSCILFNLLSYNVENGDDLITFYDGDNIFSPVIGNINGGGNGQNHGGVCYSVSASSGCLTVQFSSDNFLNYEGFYGTWECTTEDCPDPDPMNIQSDPSFQDIENNFQNPLMDVTVTNINCPQGALGVFTDADNTGLGMDDGLVLTTGLASEIPNPAAGFLASTDHFAGGDPDMEYMHETYSNGVGGTGDACFIEMDVTPKLGRIGFDYIFGSDEYKQNFSQFSNDLMAIMVSGIGIPGEPGLNNQENLAFLPGNAAVAIQNVNSSNRWEFYRNNLNSQTIAYNGLTSDFLGSKKTLLAQRNVTPCETYKVKLAIADTDTNDDSGLFVRPTQEGIPVVDINFQTGIDYLVEGCTNIEDILEISMPNPINTTLVFMVEMGGSAVKGQDYTTNVPVQIIFQPGETSVSYPISAINDGIVEGTETIEITLRTNFGCGEIIFDQTTIEIKDALEVDILPEQDTVFVCEGIFTADLQGQGAASYEWSPVNIFDDANSQNPTATISSDQLVTVVGSLGSCSATDEVFLQIIDPDVSITPSGTIQICEGESVQLTSSNNVNDAGLSWNPGFGLDDPTATNPTATPSFTTTYTLSVETQGGCTATDEITIEVEPFDFPELTTTDTLICQNSSVLLGSSIPNSSTIFEWTPSDGLNNPNVPNATATPDVSTLYTLNATSVNGLCTQSATVNIDVFPADVDIQNPDTLEICLGDTVQINALTSTGGLGLTWSPVDSLSSTTDELVLAYPQYSTWYYATLEVGSCTVRDSVYIRVDSLPDLTIQAIPQRDMYCEGEIISLASQGYPASAYLDIEHQWIPITGAISEDSLLNLVIAATETTTYFRVTANHACADTSEIEIIVVPTAEITVSPDNPVVCPGEPVQLMASSPDIDEFEWSPDVGLSCTDCFDPVANPPATIDYLVSGEFMGCPSSAVVTVEVQPAPIYELNPTTICQGESVVLNNVVDPTATYEWVLDDGTFYSDEAMPSATLGETTTFIMTISNGICPSIEDVVTINVIQEADLELIADNPETICNGDVVNLEALISTEGGTYEWSHDASATGSKVSHVPTQTTTYNVLYTAPMGCFSRSASLTITVVENFIIDTLSANPECLFEGEELSLTALTSPVLSNAIYEWSTEGLDYGSTATNTTIVAPPIISEDSTFLNFYVEITDEVGCSAMDTVAVQIKKSFFAMPNAFTPDGDEWNNFFLPHASGNVEILDFKIWSRWGDLVYNNDSNDTGWDGNYKGKAAQVDVYVYQIKYEFAGVEQSESGEVTLLR